MVNGDGSQDQQAAIRLAYFGGKTYRPLRSRGGWEAPFGWEWRIGGLRRGFPPSDRLVLARKGFAGAGLAVRRLEA